MSSSSSSSFLSDDRGVYWAAGPRPCLHEDSTGSLLFFTSHDLATCERHSAEGRQISPFVESFGRQAAKALNNASRIATASGGGDVRAEVLRALGHLRASPDLVAGLPWSVVVENTLVDLPKAQRETAARLFDEHERQWASRQAVEEEEEEKEEEEEEEEEEEIVDEEEKTRVEDQQKQHFKYNVDTLKAIARSLSLSVPEGSRGVKAPRA